MDEQIRADHLAEAFQGRNVTVLVKPGNRVAVDPHDGIRHGQEGHRPLIVVVVDGDLGWHLRGILSRGRRRPQQVQK
jgi:hypothetical protein